MEEDKGSAQSVIEIMDMDDSDDNAKEFGKCQEKQSVKNVSIDTPKNYDLSNGCTYDDLLRNCQVQFFRANFLEQELKHEKLKVMKLEEELLGKTTCVASTDLTAPFKKQKAESTSTGFSVEENKQSSLPTGVDGDMDHTMPLSPISSEFLVATEESVVETNKRLAWFEQVSRAMSELKSKGQKDQPILPMEQIIAVAAFKVVYGFWARPANNNFKIRHEYASREKYLLVQLAGIYAVRCGMTPIETKVAIEKVLDVNIYRCLAGGGLFNKNAKEKKWEAWILGILVQIAPESIATYVDEAQQATIKEQFANIKTLFENAFNVFHNAPKRTRNKKEANSELVQNAFGAFQWNFTPPNITA